MAKAWKFDINTGDRVIPLEIVEGKDEFTQRLCIALNTYYKEFFANENLGVDFYNSILKRVPDTQRLKQEILKVLSGFDEIIHVNDIRIEKTNYDTYLTKIEIYSIYGTDIFKIEVGGSL
jgi:hypothetical protein